MEEIELQSLGSLARGEAVISTRTQPTPQTISVSPAARAFEAETTSLTAEASPWPCGCTSTTEHYRAWNAQDQAARIMALPVGALYATAGLSSELRSRSTDDLKTLAMEVGTNPQCLAWCGIRKIVTNQFQLNELAEASQDVPLANLFEAWSNARDRASGTAPTGARAIANAAYPTDQFPLSQLGGSRWDENLLDVVNWAKEQLLEVSRLVDLSFARSVLIAAIREGVRDAQLQSGVADGIARRAGLAP